MKTAFKFVLVLIVALTSFASRELYKTHATEGLIQNDDIGIEIKKYKVESYLDEYYKLPKELKVLVEGKLATSWNLDEPDDDTFYIASGRFEDTWGIIVFTAKDKYNSGEVPLPEGMEVHVGNYKQLIYSMDKKGNYVAAFEDDANLKSVLDLIPDDELSLQTKILAWNYPSELDKSISTTPKFPWQGGVSYKVTPHRANSWHQDGFGRWAVDYIPLTNNENNRKILSPVSGTLTELCKGSQQTYLKVKSSNNQEFSILHLDTRTVPSNLIKNGTVTQGDYLGSIYNGSHNQTRGCIQRTDGPHVHFGLPSRNYQVDGYTYGYQAPTRNNAQTLTLKDRNGNTIGTITNHNLVSSQKGDNYEVEKNCRNGSSGSYCLDRTSSHIIKGKMEDGENSQGKKFIEVTVKKVDGGDFAQNGKIKIYDDDRNMYLNRLDSSRNLTNLSSEISYRRGDSQVRFFIDPYYLNLNESNDLSIRLLSSNGSTMYINYFRASHTR